MIRYQAGRVQEIRVIPDITTIPILTEADGLIISGSLVTISQSIYLCKSDEKFKPKRK
jgi:hypothetical protein